MKKKIILWVLLLMTPFFVNASDFEKIELKWSITEDVINFSDAFITDNRIILKSGYYLYSYDKNGTMKSDKLLDSYFYIVQITDNELILVFNDEIILIDENLEVIADFKVNGTIRKYYVEEDCLLVFSDLVVDSKDEFHFYRLDYDLDVLNEDVVEIFGGSSVIFSDGQYKIEDYYDNEFYIDDYQIKPVDSLDDGSYFVYYKSFLYKYDKDKKLIKSLNLDNSENKQYSFKHYLLNDKIYFSSFSYVPRAANDGYNYYTIHLYLVDFDLNVIKENSISNPNRALKMYYPSDYSYGLYLNNDNIYVYDGSAIYARYYLVADDLTLTVVTSDEAIPERKSSTIESSTEEKIRNSLRQLEDSDANFDYYFDYIKNSDGGYVVAVYMYRDSNIGYEHQNVMIFMDDDFNVTSTIVVNEWSSVDESMYPDYAENYPCFSKSFDSRIVEYKKDYIVYVGNTPISSIIRIYDKKGNIIKDLSNDVKNMHMGPIGITVKDNGIFIGLIENFTLWCPSGVDSTMGELDEESVLGRQLLYYDSPYNIFTSVEGKGSVDVSNSFEFSGNEILFEVKPEDEYELKEVKVTDANGNVVVFTDYKFTMPNADVTIEAVFVPKNPETSDIVFMLILFIIGIFIIVRIKFKKKISWLS